MNNILTSQFQTYLFLTFIIPKFLKFCSWFTINPTEGSIVSKWNLNKIWIYFLVFSWKTTLFLTWYLFSNFFCILYHAFTPCQKLPPCRLSYLPKLPLNKCIPWSKMVHYNCLEDVLCVCCCSLGSDVKPTFVGRGTCSISTPLFRKFPISRFPCVHHWCINFLCFRLFIG